MSDARRQTLMPKATGLIPQTDGSPSVMQMRVCRSLAWLATMAVVWTSVCADDDATSTKPSDKTVPPKWVKLPTEKAWLVVGQSNMEDGGLGVFVAPESEVVKAGTTLTSYGTKTVKAQDVYGTASQFYAVNIPRRPHHRRVGEKWGRKVPAVVAKGEPVGHLINDGALPQLDETNVPSDFPEIVEQYWDESEAAANVMFAHDAFDKTSFELIAMRDIQPGEELYMTYGAPWWLGNLMAFSPDPLMRLVVYVYISQVEPTYFFDGHAFIDHKNGKLMHSKTKQPPTEAWCKQFLSDALKADTDDAYRAKSWGLTKTMGYCQRLKHMMHVVIAGRAAYGVNVEDALPVPGSAEFEAGRMERMAAAGL